jgi:multidrug resistance efflux pump
VVRTSGRVEHLAEIGEIVVATRGAVPVRVKDVAQVTSGRELRTGSASVNGAEVVLGTALMLVGGNLQAQDAAVAVAQANIRTQQAQIEVLTQRKAYQRVVAPFDGVVTQRNVDNGSLVQADATGGMAMFTLMHSDVIRVQVYVPQDQAFGLAPGVEAIVRVPELPGVDFRGIYFGRTETSANSRDQAHPPVTLMWRDSAGR